MILQVEDIHVYYGDSHILHGISLVVNEGEIVGLLGRNGAGKTTTLRTIAGLNYPRKGSIKFKGEDITRMDPYKRARLGIGFVPDDRRIFPDLTVRENLEISRYADSRRRWNIDKIFNLFPRLKELSSHRGIHLSGGEQKMLSIGRALMLSPDLLLLDEPSEGLSPIVVRNLIEIIKEIRSQGVTILLADQNVKFAKKIVDRAYIIDKGAIVYQGEMKTLWENEEIVKRYLAV
ncbi:MAG: ABC transporter ATP-binding protein [Nitrososphaerota archaeon]|nr:ABC transporter ATP-binding protein [Nitrososphaerales archaeon]MDW8044200.1 ABC transporter ATP-binding protein [Nitrososphaerota archaeon]